MSVLELDRVTYTYPNAPRPSLSDVSLEIGAGELVVLAGSTGSGKSTLLRVANGLVPHFHGGVFSGRAVAAGMDTREHGPGDLATAIGTLFQDPETQVLMTTVRAELAFPLENRGATPAAVARGVEEAALALGIAHLLDRPTTELSGGELQRVALGAALAGRPSLVVLDEPTSQLDPVAGDELIGLLRRLNEDSDTAILLAEHRLERCLSAADRVIALVDGRIACDESPADFLEWAARSAPELATPGARLLHGVGLRAAPGVKGARAALRAAGRLPAPGVIHRTRGYDEFDGSPRSGVEALRVRRVWYEVHNGPAILRSLSLTVNAGERVALMGRNGAGKSTLLRTIGRLLEPTRGKITSAGRIALLLQNPNDYLIHDTVAEEASEGALRKVSLDAPRFAAANPRDLSGGEKQRLALAIVLDAPAHEAPAVVCLDEPTRGMDRRHKADLARLLRGLGDAAVIVATHDPEFVATFADRVVLLADGRTIADAVVEEVLCDGTYFATETARILGGAALRPEDAIVLLSAHEVPA